MDAYHPQQQPHRYMRPPQPPPSTSDPHPLSHPQQPGPPLPPPNTWYSNQFQYHPPPPSSHSPSPPPPPPPPQNWAPPPPPHSDSLVPPPPSYPLPPHPYPTHHQYPPPTRPHVPPPQSYPQEWGNQNWSHQQSRDYPAHNNAEDWAARARAWADAKKVIVEDQPPQPQFTQVGRLEEHNQYYEHYPPQAVDSYSHEVHQQPFPASGYQPFPSSAASSHPQPMVYPPENVSFNSGPSSYVPDGHLPYSVGAGISAGAPTTSPSVHQQEVPSCYPSVTGKEEAVDQKEQLHKSLSFPAQERQYHLQPLPPAYGNQAADPIIDIGNWPLDFTPNFSRDHESHTQSNYAAHDPSGTIRGTGASTPMPSSSWAPAVTTGAVYPPIPPVLSSGPQHDPSIAVPSPVSGHATLQFGSFPGSSFQPPIPPAEATYGVGAGIALHPTTGFPGDSYGIANVSERPKKASVPNWLKEEIIKNNPVITRPSLDHPREAIQSIEDEDVDRPFEKGDQADGKSIDSSRSTEEEEDDEDYVEAARNAAINQEIKLLLTEVLLKVTDELFDEIATKVIDEDDLPAEVDHTTVTSNHKVSSSPPSVPTPKASAKVLVPVKAKKSETESLTENSSSSSPGNVLGLANYASDEDDENQSSSMSNFGRNVDVQQLSTPKLSEDMHDAVENGVSQLEHLENGQETKLRSNLRKTSSTDSNKKIGAAFSELSEHAYSSKVDSGTRDSEISVGSVKNQQSNNGSRMKSTLGGSVLTTSELLHENASVKKLITHFPQVPETRSKPDQDSQHESIRSYSGKDYKEAEFESGVDQEGDDKCRRQDEKHLRKEKNDDQNCPKGRKKKESSDKAGGKAKESESRKRSMHLDVKEDVRDVESSDSATAKEDANKKQEQTKDKEKDRARHKSTSESRKHKRRHSSSISSRGKDNKDNDSSDEVSNDSKRKLHSRKRNLSPSPVRSRRRQVSRSPHSKHSQRRHSPYSSLETTRTRRSRSKSPVRRYR